VQLDSARELKATLLSSIAEPLSSRPRLLAPFGVAAMRVERARQPQPALALGIARRGRRQYQLAVRVQNRGLMDSDVIEEVVRAARKEADVRFVGRVRKRSVTGPLLRSRQRPITPGLSISHVDVTAGTLGAFVRNRRGSVRILSNNHVLADENRAARGDGILQPGRLDEGRVSRDRIGSLDRFVRLKTRGTNSVDAALARFEDVEYDPDLPGLGSVGPDIEADVDQQLQKVGRTTGVTTGRVTAIEVDNVRVGYEMGTIRFDGQIEIEGETETFSRPGDSGSLVFASGDRSAVGLLFAGSEQGGSLGHGLTYANPIASVIEQLGIEPLR
jgi:hypothetical protein